MNVNSSQIIRFCLRFQISQACSSCWIMWLFLYYLALPALKILQIPGDTKKATKYSRKHMLEKFGSVNKIGLFESYSHSSGCDFGEVTLIYGENGVGKSTLAAILDSLREGNADEIIRRRSLPGNVAPNAVVRLNGKDYTFNGSNWDSQLPHDTLDVFYPGFVTRNVHSATGVDPEHRRNLCEFVIGRKAVDKVARLANADTES